MQVPRTPTYVCMPSNLFRLLRSTFSPRPGGRCFLWLLTPRPPFACFQGASWVDVPSEGLEILGFRWAPDGGALLLLTKDKVCCCYLSEPDNGIPDDDEHASAGEEGEGDRLSPRQEEEEFVERGGGQEAVGVVDALGL